MEEEEASEKTLFSNLQLRPELLLEVFLRVPFKYTLRCKAVCKQWNRLISEPFFTSNYNSSSIPNHPVSLILIPHYHVHDQNPCYSKEILGYERCSSRTREIVGFERTQPRDVHGPFLVEDGFIRVLGSCNGLVAVYNSHGEFCLFNPITGEQKPVRVSSDQLAKDELWAKSDYYGLFHDPATNEYEAVVHTSDCFYLVSFKDGGNIKSIITTQQQQQPLKTRWPSYGFINVKGVPHWICNIIDSSSSQVYAFFYLDRVAEEIRMVGLPPKAERAVHVACVGVLDGQLTVGLEAPAGVEVWVLRDYVYGDGDSCWRMLFVMKESPLYFFEILGWLTDDDEVLMSGLMVYSVRSQSLRRRIMDLDTSFYEIATCHPSQS